MTVYFLDTSALVKQYLDEPGSDAVHTLFDRSGTSLSTSELVLLETLSAFTKKRRTLAISSATYVEARGNLTRDLQVRLIVAPRVEGSFVEASALIHLYRERSIGCNDLLHLITAEHLQATNPAEAVTFLCADARLGTLAAERGFAVFDPESDDPAGL